MSLLRALKPRVAAGPTKRAVIDIGSSSLRLVVWSGAARLPTMILNEKVTANLGRTLAKDGRLPRKAMTAALQGLARFAVLIRTLGVDDVRLVATAAVRDAENGAAFLDQVRALGLSPELLSGEQEARASAFGVISAFPDADGIVGDLGGGSLELVEVANGAPGRGDSFPWGTLRLAALREQPGDLDRIVSERLSATGWVRAAKGRPLYLVGGSWRALTMFAIDRAGYPLADPHGHVMAASDAAALADALDGVTERRLRQVPGLPSSRLETLPAAAALLASVVRQLRPERLITSAFGLREGLLYETLDTATRAQDPLFVAIEERAVGAPDRLRHGQALAEWIAPLFADEPAGLARLRRAACMLAALVQPGDARGAQALTTMFDHRWIAIDTADRATITAALLGDAGERAVPEIVGALGEAEDMQRALRWGQAIRFARKLSGGAAAVLERSMIGIADDQLRLTLPAELAPLYSDNVKQQHDALATAMALNAVCDSTG